MRGVAFTQVGCMLKTILVYDLAENYHLESQHDHFVPSFCCFYIATCAESCYTLKVSALNANLDINNIWGKTSKKNCVQSLYFVKVEGIYFYFS